MGTEKYFHVAFTSHRFNDTYIRGFPSSFVEVLIGQTGAAIYRHANPLDSTVKKLEKCFLLITFFSST